MINVACADPIRTAASPCEPRANGLHPLTQRRPPHLSVMAASAPGPAGRMAGFTLLELLVVIAILGLLIGLIAPAALHQLGSARLSIVRQSVERIGSVLDMYKLDVGSYPSTDQGLAALVDQPSGVTTWNGPYMKGGVPVDPWNHAYAYRNPSTRSGHDYDLCSSGPDNASRSEICTP
jgi:general secretion pathway protein G